MVDPLIILNLIGQMTSEAPAIEAIRSSIRRYIWRDSITLQYNA